MELTAMIRASLRRVNSALGVLSARAPILTVVFTIEIAASVNVGTVIMLEPGPVAFDHQTTGLFLIVVLLTLSGALLCSAEYYLQRVVSGWTPAGRWTFEEAIGNHSGAFGLLVWYAAYFLILTGVVGFEIAQQY
jgi:hypothetical protein